MVVQGPQGPQGPQGSINGDDDDVMLIPAAGFRSPSGGSGGASDFSRLKTPLLLLLEILLFVGVLVAAFVLPRFLQRKEAPDVQPDYAIPYYILLYAQSMLWFVIFIIDRALWLQHRKVGRYLWRSCYELNALPRLSGLVWFRWR